MTSNDELYLDSSQAIAMLGINRQTLYAYVSRKLIRSERIDGSRRRRYWKGDVMRLAGPSPKPDAASQQSPLTSESRITLLLPGSIYFRGHDAIALSDHIELEQLAALLWQTEASTFDKAPTDAGAAWRKIRPGVAKLGLAERLLTLFPVVERLNMRAHDLSPAGYARAGIDALRWAAAVATHGSTPDTQPLHRFIGRALAAPPGFDDVIRRLLILAADHEFDPIAHSVRAMANVGVTPYKILATGLMASQGQRLQTERYDTAMRFLAEILAARDTRTPIMRRLQAGERLPGFNGAVGEQADPRTAAMMQALGKAMPGDMDLKRLRAADRYAFEATGKRMEFIIPALYIGHRLGLHGEELGVAALGRMVGWIAHAMEQFHDHLLIRPRANYTGWLPGGPPALVHPT